MLSVKTGTEATRVLGVEEGSWARFGLAEVEAFMRRLGGDVEEP